MPTRARVAVLRTRPETVTGGRRPDHGAGRRPRAPRPRRDHHPQGQHLLALPVPGRQHDAVAARGDDPEAARRRLRRPGLRPEQHGGHRPQEGRAAQPLPAGARQVRRAGALQLLPRGPEVDDLPAQGEDAGAAARSTPRGSRIPEFFLGKNIVHLPDGQVPHLHHHHRGDEERLRRPPQHPPALHPLVDPRDAGRPADDPEGDPQRPLRGDGRHDLRQRPRPADHDPGGEGHPPRLGRPGGDRRRGGQDHGLRPDVDQVHPAGPRRRPRLRRPARHRGRRRGRLELELPLLGRGQRGVPLRRPRLVRAAQGAAEAALPHAAGLSSSCSARTSTTTTPGTRRSASAASSEYKKTSKWMRLFEQYPESSEERAA